MDHGTFDLAAKLQLLHFGPQLLAAIWNSDQYLSPASSQLCRLLCINSFFGVPFLHEQKCSRIFSLLFSKALFGAVEQKMNKIKRRFEKFYWHFTWLQFFRLVTFSVSIYGSFYFSLFAILIPHGKHLEWCTLLSGLYPIIMGT